ncbi:hypothetical protein NDA11_007086 [Ustilago hordei]|nr:hypothetical protein NDA11_007086 [Ustilago hordei]
MVEVRGSYVPGASRPTFGAELVVESHDTECSFLESDLLLLINLAERSLMLAAGSGASEHPNVAAGRGEASAAADSAAAGPQSPTINEKSGQQDSSASGLLGYVSNVFSSDGGAGPEKTETDAKSQSLDAIKSKVQLRCRRTLERIYCAHPAETVESLLHCWQSSVRASRKTCDEHATQAVIEILDIVTPSAQILVTFLCDVLGARIGRSDSERAKKTAHAQNSNNATSISDATLFSFFDAVLARMEPGEATQVCPVVIVFVKDFVANSLARKVHDRRTKRDLQDNFVKLIDSCILISGRLFDQSTWNRRSGRDNGEELDREAAEFAAELLSLEDEKLSVNADGNSANGVIDAINHFLTTRGLPALRKIQMDTDRVQAIVANAAYYRAGRLLNAATADSREAGGSAEVAGERSAACGSLSVSQGGAGQDTVAAELDSIVGSADGRGLLLSTLKLLDLLVLLQPEDFQINEWLFITDTIDAVYPSDDFQPETLLDGLSATFQKESSKHSHQHHHHQHGNASEPGKIGKRRLQLGRMRTIGSVGELGPFLNSVSQNAFESNYGDQEVDLHDVDACQLNLDAPVQRPQSGTLTIG